MILESKRQHDTSNLESLQTWLQWIITDPRGVSDALENPNPAAHELQPLRFKSENNKICMQRYQRPNVDYLSSIEFSPSFDRVERLTIYAEAYFARISDSLGEDFSSVKRLVGEEGFLQLVSDYLKVHPSRFESLAEVGCDFANFLTLHEVSKFLPYLADLATLEWLLIESFYTPESNQSNLDEIREIAPEAWKNIRFELSPSVRLMCSSWTIDRFWSREENHILKQIRRILIFREDGIISVTSVQELEFLILQMVASNSSLEKICTYLESITEMTSFDQLERQFAKWIKNGVINRVK